MMSYIWKVSLKDESGVFECWDQAGLKYCVEIGPRRSAEYFANLFTEGLVNTCDVEVSSTAKFERRDMGFVICRIIYFQDSGLFKFTNPETGESRSIEIHPRSFAEWLFEGLKKRPNTRIEITR